MNGRTSRLRCHDPLPIVDAGDEALRVEVVVLVDPGSRSACKRRQSK
jgi:hypothetical protein